MPAAANSPRPKDSQSQGYFAFKPETFEDPFLTTTSDVEAFVPGAEGGFGSDHTNPEEPLSHRWPSSEGRDAGRFSGSPADPHHPAGDSQKPSAQDIDSSNGQSLETSPASPQGLLVLPDNLD